MTIFLSKKQLVKIIPYSMTHIQRMISKDQFPRPVKPSGYAAKEPRNAKCFWVEEEVQQWMSEQIADRDSVAP